jgi:glycerophosphoryl diester phosphodiesterase
MKAYFDAPLPHVFAHRGFALNSPENSLAAFSDALRFGATHIETDVRCSRDGVPVLIHDAQIGHLLVSETEVSNFPDFVATLEGALERFPEARFNIDIKSSDAIIPTVTVVKNMGAEDRVLITSFSDKRRKKALAIMGNVATSSSAISYVVALISLRAGLTGIAAYFLRNIDALQIPEKSIGINASSQTMIARFKKLGILVYFWTINDSDVMVELVRRGADGVVTDRTDIAVKTLKMM